jgi:LysR family transcriptional activator of mexEF-oprN operon
MTIKMNRIHRVSSEKISFMMNDIQLRNVDLNLLVVFEVLMEELHVARAADRLGRTPSAISHSLARLRDTFGDPLLVKSGGKMRPSPTALVLAEEVRPILRSIQRLVQPPEAFDAASSSRVFRIAGPPLDSVIADFAARANAAAPHIRLEWLPQSQTTYAQVIDEQIDLAYGNATTPLPEGLRERLMPPLKRVVFARRDHPGLGKWNIQTWLGWPHIVVGVTTSATADSIERQLGALGLERKVGLRLPDWSAIGPVLLRTDMFAVQNGLVLGEYPDLSAFRILEPPISVPGFATRVFWNARLEADPAQSWLRATLIDCLEGLIRQANARIDNAGVRPQEGR